MTATTKSIRDEARRRLLEMFENQLQHAKHLAEKATENLADSVSTRGVLYALEWYGHGAASWAAQGELWETVGNHYRNARSYQHNDDLTGNLVAAVQALNIVIAEVEHQLLNNGVRKSSPAEFTTAVSGARAEAHATWLREAKGLLGALQK